LRGIREGVGRRACVSVVNLRTKQLREVLGLVEASEGRQNRALQALNSRKSLVFMRHVKLEKNQQKITRTMFGEGDEQDESKGETAEKGGMATLDALRALAKDLEGDDRNAYLALLARSVERKNGKTCGRGDSGEGKRDKQGKGKERKRQAKEKASGPTRVTTLQCLQFWSLYYDSIVLPVEIELAKEDSARLTLWAKLAPTVNLRMALKSQCRVLQMILDRLENRLGGGAGHKRSQSSVSSAARGRGRASGSQKAGVWRCSSPITKKKTVANERKSNGGLEAVIASMDPVVLQRYLDTHTPVPLVNGAFEAKYL
jgi:hypothetical protein